LPSLKKLSTGFAEAIKRAPNIPCPVTLRKGVPIDGTRRRQPRGERIKPESSIELKKPDHWIGLLLI